MQCTQEKQEKRVSGRKGGLGAEQQRLLEEYRDVLAQQKQVRAAFEQVTDPELISACVYEMNALQRRYSHLLQKIREENLRCFQVLR